jgi:hypothetical protein
MMHLLWFCRGEETEMAGDYVQNHSETNDIEEHDFPILKKYGITSMNAEPIL